MHPREVDLEQDGKAKPGKGLKDTLTGDSDSGGLAGQGGMTDLRRRAEDPAEGNYRDLDDEG